MDVEGLDDVASNDADGHNIGELIRQGVALTTREVLAIIHEVCRDAAAFPESADDLWLTRTGELLVARSDQITAPIDPRSGVAVLLETMLPPDGATQPDRNVPKSLRGLPARLRATTENAGPRDRRDLMSILSWHLGGDPRQTVQELTQRVFQSDAAALAVGRADDDIDLFPTAEPTAAAPPVAEPSVARPRRARAGVLLTLGGLMLLFLAVGVASYWFFRSDVPAAGVSTESELPASQVVRAGERPASPPAAAPAGAAPVFRDAPHALGLPVSDGAFSPTFAAAGRELFFHEGRSAGGRLLVADLDPRGEVARVSAVRSDGARDYHVRVSPDGRWIAFDSDRDGQRGVYVARREGTDLQRVSGGGYAAVPSWSPDMKHLAFVRGEAARPRVWNLWLRDLSTGALQRHTSFRSGQVWGASWFPDGRTIAYSHETQLVISHLDAREDIVIDSPRPGQLVRTPAVSPDGKSIVFQVFKDGVWLLDVATRSMRRILGDPTAEEFAWSPDGERIAYHSRRDGAWRIWIAPVPSAAGDR